MEKRFVPLLLGADINVYSMARAFHEAYGVKTIVYGMFPASVCAGSRIIDYRVREHNDRVDKVLENVTEVAREFPDKKILVLGCGDNYLNAISANLPRYPENVIAPYVSLDMLETLIHKEKFYELCDRYGIDHPATVVYHKGMGHAFELPFDGGPEHELLCYRGNAYYEEYSGEALYYLDYREDESSCDLCCVGPGGAKEILVEDFAAQPAVRKTTVPFTSGNVFIYGFVNEYVLVNHLYSEQYDDAGNMELLYTQYAVNQNTGEITEITLSNYSMATQKAINIIAQFGDDLLVDAKEGSENDLAYRRTGFIRVEDYLASNPNYRMVAQAYVESAQLA